jgi:hypothetical protein
MGFGDGEPGGEISVNLALGCELILPQPADVHDHIIAICGAGQGDTLGHLREKTPARLDMSRAGSVLGVSQWKGGHRVSALFYLTRGSSTPPGGHHSGGKSVVPGDIGCVLRCINRFGVPMGTSSPASDPRCLRLRGDALSMIPLIASQGDFCATASGVRRAKDNDKAHRGLFFLCSC